MICLGKSEATARLAFGCLSRAKRLVDLLVDTMPLDSLSELGAKSTLKIRNTCTTRGETFLVIVVVAVDRVLVMISLIGLTIGGGVSV